MNNTLIEVICQSVDDCIRAEKASADRIELLSALALGGISPSLATLIEAKKHVLIPIVVMLRPRAGGYVYSQLEMETMYEDARLYLENGADGLVFGSLNEDGTIQVEFTEKIISLCHKYNKEAIYNRAIDVTNNYKQVEKLIGLGINRILTSGFAGAAEEGIENLKRMIAQYGAHVEILPGSGISAYNVEKILKETNATQIHFSSRGWEVDPTNTLNPKTPMWYDETQKEKYEVFSKDKYYEIKNILKKN